jgi:hypothetical protein
MWRSMLQHCGELQQPIRTAASIVASVSGKVFKIILFSLGNTL